MIWGYPHVRKHPNDHDPLLLVDHFIPFSLPSLPQLPKTGFPAEQQVAAASLEKTTVTPPFRNGKIVMES
jgi:hypothetical protein